MRRDRLICYGNPTLSHSALTPAPSLHGTVPVEVPHEPLDKLLLLRLGVLDDGDGDGGGVVLVLGQPDGGDPLGGLLVALRPVERLQVLEQLRLSANPPLGSLERDCIKMFKVVEMFVYLHQRT